MDILDIMKSENLCKIIYQSKEYYYHSDLKLIDLMDFKLSESIDNFQHGLNGNMQGFMFFTVTSKTYEKKTPLGKGSIYPKEFIAFWENYHKKRRLGKKVTFNAWSKLSLEDKENACIAAHNYTVHINAESSPEFMYYPERFIKKRFFEDFLDENEDQNNVNLFIEYFQECFNSKFKFKYSFTAHEKSLINMDVENLSLIKIKELCYIFFNDLDGKVKDANRNEHYSYNVFSSLLKGVLGSTKKKIKEVCGSCGLRGSHKIDCPVIAQRNLKREEDKKEAIEAKEANIDIMGMFKKNIKENRSKICTDQ